EIDKPRPFRTGGHVKRGVDTLVPDERWAQIKNLFESAISQDVSERDAFLAFQCGSDDDLRREVQSLLSAYDSTGDFLEDPCFELKSFARDLENGGVSQPLGS